MQKGRHVTFTVFIPEGRKPDAVVIHTQPPACRSYHLELSGKGDVMHFTGQGQNDSALVHAGWPIPRLFT